MKYLKKIKATAITMLLLTLLSCSTEPEIGSTVTYFPEIILQGSTTIFIPLGSVYNDPGVIATENGETIEFTSQTVGKYRASNKLDTNIQDEYTQTYTAVNKDGFDATVTRTIIVYNTGDLVNSIEGVYTSTVARNGSTPSDAYVDMKYIYIWKNTNGTYEISDAFGGWYLFGRAIAGSGSPGGIINAVDINTNTFTFPGNPFSNDYFGGVVTLKSINVNAATKKVVISTDWDAGPYTFVSTLTQVQF
ncbi:hypothetical protein HNQ02_002582 [Flavobacterium sp. 7E]|uniref:immunoglobulin-like domain-containing protein n=1 Tax=Flavobacterium sp. 7E TaxID=2735898 RepID=UPI00156FD675|nr:immunoglobulin-like domain-containing protein [Flavobacterium sp. 7E]NRS89651.1 hypothetical protein [Flavobacterium sp. 7E]